MMLTQLHRDATVDWVRTTVTLAPDVAAEVLRRRRERGQGTSDAINELCRRGLAAVEPQQQSYRLPVAALGARIPLDNIAEVLDLLDEE